MSGADCLLVGKLHPVEFANQYYETFVYLSNEFLADVDINSNMHRKPHHAESVDDINIISDINLYYFFIIPHQ